MKRVLLRGPLLTQSGYGHHARTVLRALRTREDIFDIYVQAINWGSTSWLWQDDEERRWLDQALEKTINYVQDGGQFDLSLQVTIPNEWDKSAPINIGITAGIETTKVAPAWLEKASIVDKIITISEHSKDTYSNTTYTAKDQNSNQEFQLSCNTPMDVVSYPVRLFEPQVPELNLTTEFNFLSVLQLSPRKNLPGLVKAFVENFRDNEDVGLILKVNTAKNSRLDRVHTWNKIKMLINQLGEKKCKIYLLHGYMNDKELSGLYNHPKVKALVTATHGEGFGLPLFEAASHGLPVIAPDWSGHLDFLYMPTSTGKGKKKKNVLKPMFSRISYTVQQVPKQAVWDGVIQADSHWAVPDEGSIKMTMDEIYRDYGRFKKRAGVLKGWVRKNFEASKQYKEYVDSILSTPGLDTDDEIESLFENIKSVGS